MKVLFAPEVEEDLITDIQQNIQSKLKKKAPAFFERYGKDMLYVTYQRNPNTTWYIFFSVDEDTYFIKYITNNHVSGQYIL